MLRMTMSLAGSAICAAAPVAVPPRAAMAAADSVSWPERARNRRRGAGMTNLLEGAVALQCRVRSPALVRRRGRFGCGRQALYRRGREAPPHAAEGPSRAGVGARPVDHRRALDRADDRA